MSRKTLAEMIGSAQAEAVQTALKPLLISARERNDLGTLKHVAASSRLLHGTHAHSLLAGVLGL